MKTDSKNVTEFEVDYKKNYLSIPSIVLFPGKNSLTPVKSAKVILQILIKTKHISARGKEIDHLSNNSKRKQNCFYSQTILANLERASKI